MRRLFAFLTVLFLLVGLSTRLPSQEPLSTAAIWNSVYNATLHTLMGVQWAGAQDTQYPVAHILNDVYVPPSGESNGYLRIQFFTVGEELPVACIPSTSLFIFTTTGQSCLCNELGDGWECYDGTAPAAGSIGPTELASTAVTPGIYGDATNVAQITFDADGRSTLAANVPIAIASAQITNGTVATEDLATTGVSAAAYGTGLLIPSITLGVDGRATAASTNPIDASFVRTYCTLGPGDTNSDASGTGAFFTHNLSCAMPSGKLTTGSVVTVCSAFHVITAGTAPSMRHRWEANGVTIQEGAANSTPATNITRNVVRCVRMLFTETPNATAAVYTFQDGNQFDLSGTAAGETDQPIDINTSGVVSFTNSTYINTNETGTNTIQLMYMLVSASGLLP